MNAQLGKLWRGLSGLRDLPGPLLAKEMLVTSRRMRYYALRFAYAGALALFIMTVWLGVVEGSAARSAGQRAQQMSELGKKLSGYIVWFQFVGAQLVAVVLLSGAISEEIHQRTLVPILTTPNLTAAPSARSSSNLSNHPAPRRRNSVLCPRSSTSRHKCGSILPGADAGVPIRRPIFQALRKRMGTVCTMGPKARTEYR